jgi:hypothetical protein
MKVPEIIHTMACFADCAAVATQFHIVGHWNCGIASRLGGSGQLNNPSGIRLGPGGQGTLWPRMADIVNLRTARKRVNRRRDEERAAKARVSHGVSKTDRALAETARSKLRRKLDEHRIETGESDEIAGR